MTQEDVEQSVLGRGAKLAGILVVVAAAFAMGLSRNNVSRDSDRQEALNQALFHQMMENQTAMNDRATASAAKDEVASTNTDPAAAPDGR